MNTIESYVDKILAKFDISKTKKEDLKLQFIDHIYSLKEDYKQKGHSEKEATSLALKDFGSKEQISDVLVSHVITCKKIPKNIIIIIFIAYLLPLFARLVYISSYDPKAARFYLSNLVPFFLSYKNKEALFSIHNTACFDILSSSLWFIPIGILMPFVIDKPYSIKSNIKVFIIFVLIIQIIKFIFSFGIGNVDYAIIHLIGCLIGFLIYRLLLRFSFLRNAFIKEIF